LEIGRSFHFVPAEFLILLAKIGAIFHLSITLLSILPESGSNGLVHHLVYSSWFKNVINSIPG